MCARLRAPPGDGEAGAGQEQMLAGNKQRPPRVLNKMPLDWRWGENVGTRWRFQGAFFIYSPDNDAGSGGGAGLC